MRQCRMGLESLQILLWALMFGDYFNISRPLKRKNIHFIGENMRAVSFVKNTINHIRPRLIKSVPDHFERRLLHAPSRYQPLWDAYEQHIPLKDRHCLHQLEQDWERRKPLRGKTVLVNVHLTRITLALVTALLKSDACVEVTVSPELVIHQNALEALLAAQIPFYSTIPEEKKQGYSGLLLESRRQESIEKIKKTLSDMWAVVTATGVEGAISQYFSQSDFNCVALLANMSTGDDFGSHFTADRILNRKKPANFMLDYPTEVMYLDPVFTLFLKAGEELLHNKTLKHGLNTIASTIDQSVLTDWITHHGECVWRHRLGQLQTEKFIEHLRLHPTLPLADLSCWVASQGIFHHLSEARPLPHLPLTP